MVAAMLAALVLCPYGGEAKSSSNESKVGYIKKQKSLLN